MSEPHDMPLIAAAKANEIISQLDKKSKQWEQWCRENSETAREALSKVDQLTKERDELRAKLECAEACGAEMRDALRVTHDACCEVAAYGDCQCDGFHKCPYCECCEAVEVAKQALAETEGK